MNIITPITTQPVTPKTPLATREPKKEERFLEIRYLARLNIMYVKGWSFTVDIHDKYAALMTDIKVHLTQNQELNVFFKYNLFNSSTAKYLFNIIRVLNQYHKRGKKVKVFWSCVEAPDKMVETGIDLRTFCEFDFHINSA